MLNNVFRAEGVADGHYDTSINNGTLFLAGGAFVSTGGAAELTPLPRYYRGALPGQEPSFELKQDEYKLSGANQVRGLSLFDNPGALEKRGYVPYEVNLGTMPPELVIERRGGNADHFEIVPANQAFPPEVEFQMMLNPIEVYGSGDAGGGE